MSKECDQKEKPIVHTVMKLLENWSAKLTESKRVWAIVLLYNKGKLVAEGRAACCKADLDNGKFNSSDGFDIAEGRARLAARKEKSYGILPGGYYKGAFYGLPKVVRRSIGPIRFPFPSPSLRGPKYCSNCGESLSPPLSEHPNELTREVAIDKALKRHQELLENREYLKNAVKICARQQ